MNDLITAPAELQAVSAIEFLGHYETETFLASMSLIAPSQSLPAMLKNPTSQSHMAAAMHTADKFTSALSALLFIAAKKQEIAAYREYKMDWDKETDVFSVKTEKGVEHTLYKVSDLSDLFAKNESSSWDEISVTAPPALISQLKSLQRDAFNNAIYKCLKRDCSNLTIVNKFNPKKPRPNITTDGPPPPSLN